MTQDPRPLDPPIVDPPTPPEIVPPQPPTIDPPRPPEVPNPPQPPTIDPPSPPVIDPPLPPEISPPGVPIGDPEIRSTQDDPIIEQGSRRAPDGVPMPRDPMHPEVPPMPGSLPI